MRILSLSFALLGNFITVSRTLTPDLLCITEPADNLISKTGRAAVEAENNALGIQGTDTLNDIWLLLIRSAVLWIAFLAFWTLFF